MFVSPSLNQDEITLYRQVDSIDLEGTPSQEFVQIETFRGGFGSVNTGRQIVRGDAGQEAEAAISTLSQVQVQVGDMLQLRGRDWKVIGVLETGVTQRFLVQAWGVR